MSVPVPPDCPLSQIEFVAFDLETTGLNCRSCRIVEFGAVRFRLDGTEVGCLEQLVDPGCFIPPTVTRIHGITNAMVQGMPAVAAFLPRFRDFLGHPDTVLLAHNASFDIGFLNAAFTHSAVELPQHTVVDTLPLARRYIGGLRNYRLETLAIHLGLADSEDHRALSDARLAKGLFLAIVKRRRDLETLQDLMRLVQPRRFAATTAATVRREVPPAELVSAIDQRQTVVMLYAGATGECVV